MDTIIFKRKKSVLKSLLFFVSGVSLFLINALIAWETNSVISPLLFIMGSIFIILSVFSFFFRKYEFISVDNSQVLKAYEVYFDVSEQNKLVQLHESGNLAYLKALKPSLVHALKLHVRMTNDCQLCFSQVVSFQGSEFINITPVKQHNMKDAKELHQLSKR